MTKRILTLALALSVLPLTALAQDANNAGPPGPTPEQRQAMQQTFQQMEQLHQQMRTQMLSTVSQVHLRAIASEIGYLAISANPDPQATAKRIDAILSPGERSRIISEHQNFMSQMMQLHQQMRSQMPTDRPMPEHPMMSGPMAQTEMRDAGWILLHALPPHGPEGMGHMWNKGAAP